MGAMTSGSSVGGRGVPGAVGVGVFGLASGRWGVSVGGGGAVGAMTSGSSVGGRGVPGAVGEGLFGLVSGALERVGEEVEELWAP